MEVSLYDDLADTIMAKYLTTMRGAMKGINKSLCTTVHALGKDNCKAVLAHGELSLLMGCLAKLDANLQQELFLIEQIEEA